MIITQKLYPPICELLMNNGYTLQQIVGESGVSVLHCDIEENTLNQIISSVSLDTYKAQRQLEVTEIAKELRNRFLSNVSPGEMASWPIKAAEAAGVLAGGTNAPLLQMEADVRGITLKEIAIKAYTNAQQIIWLEANISGVDGKHRDAITALSTWDEVFNYDVTTNWPQV